MGAWVDQERCDGCGACMKICPGDLLHLNDDKKAENRYPNECWHCMACSKACSKQAVVVNLPFTIANRGARLTPKVGTKGIRWQCITENGEMLEFQVEG
jgi:adenylylsulfate reductase subunit B